MSYGNAKQVTISIGENDFGSGNVDYRFQVPEGKEANLKEVLVLVTETMTNTTLEGTVDIGKTAGATQYASCGLGTTAAGDVYVMTNNAGDLVAQHLPANTDIFVRAKAPTGGTPAGKGHIQIVLDTY